MNIVDENVIFKILNSYHAKVDDLKITELKWSLNTKIVEAGSNHLSQVYRLTISYKNNGKLQETVVFVKAPCNCVMYETASKWGAYVKEVLMYTSILPQIYTFEEKYFTAQNYYEDENHSLFLEDLCQSGYKIADRIQQLDFQHCVYALKCLAKLHGLSVHLERTSGLPEVIRKNPFHQNDKMSTGLEVSQLKFYNYLDPTIQERYVEKIKFFKTIDWDRAMDDLKPENSSFNVLNHRDYWTNNIMFKYNENGIVEKAKMIDLQLCYWGNPASDLIFFAITSMRFEVYSKYFHLLCSIYLDTLNKILANFGHRSYKMEELKKDIEKMYAYGIVLMLYVLPISAADPNDPVDLNEAVGGDGEFDSTAVHKAYGQKHYTELATKWFLHFAQKDIPEFENKYR